MTVVFENERKTVLVKQMWKRKEKNDGEKKKQNNQKEKTKKDMNDISHSTSSSLLLIQLNHT